MKRKAFVISVFFFVFLIVSPSIWAETLIAGVGGEGKKVETQETQRVFGIDREVLRKYTDLQNAQRFYKPNKSYDIYIDYQYQAFRNALKGELTAFMSWTTDPIIKSMANTFNDKLDNDSTFFQELISSINAAGPLYFSTDGTIWSTNSSSAYGQWMYNTPKLFLSSGSTLLCSWSVCWYDRHNPGNQDGGMLADVWSAAQTKLSPDVEKTGTTSTTIEVGSRRSGQEIDTSVIELKGGASLKNSEDFKNLKTSTSAHINIVVSILTNAPYTGGGNQTIINEAVNDVNKSNMSPKKKQALIKLIEESVNNNTKLSKEERENRIKGIQKLIAGSNIEETNTGYDNPSTQGVNENVTSYLSKKESAGESFNPVYRLTVDYKDIDTAHGTGNIAHGTKGTPDSSDSYVNQIKEHNTRNEQGVSGVSKVSATLNLDKNKVTTTYQNVGKDVKSSELGDKAVEGRSKDRIINVKTGAGQKIYDDIHTVKYKLLGQSRAEEMGYKFLFYDEGCAQYCSSPLVLDMDGDGKLEASGGQWNPHPGSFTQERLAEFDFWGNGFPVLMEWVGPTDGLLVVPKQDGSIDGTCFFGTSEGYPDGFSKLSLLDTNKDGVVFGKELEGLYVWQDRNQDAKVDNGELKTIQELGITSIGLNHKNGKAIFVMNNKTHAVYDWWPTMTDVRITK